MDTLSWYLRFIEKELPGGNILSEKNSVAEFKRSET